jgi:hypothetical protein
MTRARTRGTERKAMRRTPWGLVLFALIVGVALASCDGPSRGSRTQPSAASGFSVALTASPNTVRGATAGSLVTNGGCSQIQVVVTKAGVLVDGAEVTVTTTLGVFKRGTENFVGLQGITTRGVAVFAWCALAERGTSIITATAEDATVTILITIF